MDAETGVDVFEEAFSQAQMNMVSRAMEYADDQVSDVLIQFTIRGNMFGGYACYARKQQVLSLDELGVSGACADTARIVFTAIAREAHRIALACQEFDRPVPIEGYLRYRVARGTLDARYLYDLDEDPEDGPTMGGRRLEQWKQTVQKELDAVG